MQEHQAQQGQEWLASLLAFSGLPIQIQLGPDLDESCWLTIDEAQLAPTQVEALTGANGAALDALQYLANTTLNLGHSDSEPAAIYTIELAGYRARRQAEIKQMAEEAAAKVRATSEEFEMGALSSPERRQVHTYLKSFGDLDTYSRGREPDRRLVVRLLSQSEPDTLS